MRRLAVIAMLLAACVVCRADNLKEIPITYGLIGAWGFTGYTSAAYTKEISGKWGEAGQANVGSPTFSSGVMDNISNANYFKGGNSIAITAMSLSFWIKFNALPAANVNAVPAMIGKLSYPYHGCWIRNVSGTYKLRYARGLSAGNRRIWEGNAGNEVGSAGVWYHVVFSQEEGANNDPTYYVNGDVKPNTKIVSAGTSPSTAAGTDMNIGSGGGSDAANAKICNVMVFNRGLSADEAKRLFLARPKAVLEN